MRLVLRLVTKVLSAKMSTTVLHELRSDVLSTYLSSPWSVKADERSGHLQDMATTFVQQNVMAVSAATRLLAGVGTLATLAISAFLLDLRFAVLIIVTLVVLFAALRPLSRLVRLFNRRSASANLRFVSFLVQITAQAQEIEVFGVAEPVGRRRA